MRPAAILRLVACLAVVAALAGVVTSRILAADPGPGGHSAATTHGRAPAPDPRSALRPPVATPVRARCFGAASVDPARPCDNARLRRTVFPTPAGARAAQRPQHCRRAFDAGLLRICFWGASFNSATRTIALIGDSHASHWRAAMQDVVRARRWRAISISRAGCPLTLAYPDLPGPRRKQLCRDWNGQVQRWVAAHRRVSVIFTGAHRGRVLAQGGLSPQAARLAGYTRAWRRLLAHGVRHIVVLRDTPRISGAALACVGEAVAAGQAAGPRCALGRGYALPPDPEADAARRLRWPRVQVADLSAFFCGPQVCPPVIGGALVLRDVSHMTTTFSATLGPYLRRTVDRLTRHWPDGRR